MAEITLKYGRGTVSLNIASEFEVLGSPIAVPGLTDAELGRRLDTPIDSAPAEERVSAGERVLIVVPDATRQTASGQIVNLLVRRLIAAGVEPFNINIIFATGIHRPVTKAEAQEILTPFIAQRVKTLDHAPRDLMRIAKLGHTAGGIPVELNRALLEADHVIIAGGAAFHYFAGFTGGRKLICPGLASRRTIAETHKLAFDTLKLSRAEGVGPGLLDGNPVHEAFVEAASFAPPAFCITAIVNEAGGAAELFCGDWIISHRAACDAYAAAHTIEVTEKRSWVVVSCGGYPFDINMIQAHKALDNAARICADGGTIVLAAECADGMGRDDMIDWFDARDSRQLAVRLSEAYKVNGQTAWNILRIAERFNVRMITALADPVLRRMRIRKAVEIAMKGRGWVVPAGAKYLLIAKAT
jgi:lactate racemase